MSKITKFYLFLLSALILMAVAGGLVIEPDKVHILYVDIGIILFGGIGFFTALLEASKMIIRANLAQDEVKLRNQLFFLKTLTAYKKSSICRVFTKGPYSPPTFDEDQKQHDIACQWASPIIKKIEDLDEENLVELDAEFYSEVSKEITEKFVLQECNELIGYIERYKSVNARVMKQRADASTHAVEEFLVFFLPILASFAIALSVFKAIYWAPPF